jgi:uncharacterized protein YegP (UPF0339 family)
MKFPITCVIYESRRLLKWSWRFKFVAANGATIGHQYDNLADALVGVRLIISPDVPMRLHVIRRTGVVEDRGLIRWSGTVQ